MGGLARRSVGPVEAEEDRMEDEVSARLLSGGPSHLDLLDALRCHSASVYRNEGRNLVSWQGKARFTGRCLAASSWGLRIPSSHRREAKSKIRGSLQLPLAVPDPQRHGPANRRTNFLPLSLSREYFT
jgi:hypothetical protein